MSRMPARPRTMENTLGSDLNVTQQGWANMSGRDNRERGGSRKSSRPVEPAPTGGLTFTAIFEHGPVTLGQSPNDLIEIPVSTLISRVLWTIGVTASNVDWTGSPAGGHQVTTISNGDRYLADFGSVNNLVHIYGLTFDGAGASAGDAPVAELYLDEQSMNYRDPGTSGVLITSTPDGLLKLNAEFTAWVSAFDLTFRVQGLQPAGAT